MGRSMANITIDEAGFRRERHADRYLKAPSEMARLFARYPEAVARTIEIAAHCNFSLDELAYQYPEERTMPGLTPQQALEKLTWEGAAERYPEGLPEACAHSPKAGWNGHHRPRDRCGIRGKHSGRKVQGSCSRGACACAVGSTQWRRGRRDSLDGENGKLAAYVGRGGSPSVSTPDVLLAARPAPPASFAGCTFNQAIEVVARGCIQTTSPRLM